MGGGGAVDLEVGVCGVQVPSTGGGVAYPRLLILNVASAPSFYIGRNYPMYILVADSSVSS
jgi:hypothetical protein